MSENSQRTTEGGKLCQRYGRETTEEHASLYVLDSLEPRDAQEFARHLDGGCEFCAREVA